MAGSLLVQTAVLPALHSSQAQFRWSAKTCAIARVTMSKLQVSSPSLRFSGTSVPHTVFLGTESILTGKAMRPVRKQARRIAVKAMFERFTEKSIKVIMLAQEESRRLGHNFVGTEQLLLGLIGEGTGTSAKVLKSMGMNLRDARVEVEKVIGRRNGFVEVAVPFTDRAKQVLTLALEEANQLGHDHVRPEHLLLGLLQVGGVAARVLESFSADPSNIRTQVTGGETELIEPVTQILQRRTKKEIGEPGLVKTAIAEVTHTAEVEGDEKMQLLQVLESCQMVITQLEVQNLDLQLERDQSKEQTNSLLGALNKIADSLSKIADKL